MSYQNLKEKVLRKSALSFLIKKIKKYLKRNLFQRIKINNNIK